MQISSRPRPETCLAPYLPSPFVLSLCKQDLKPSNILVTEDNHVSLIDFGLARQLRALDAEAPTEDKKDPMKSTTAMARKLTQHVVGGNTFAY